MKNIWKAGNTGNKDGSFDLSFDYPRLIETSTKKTGFFWLPNILREIKRLSNNIRKPSKQGSFCWWTNENEMELWLAFMQPFIVFFTILLMYTYRKATKVQVKIVLKISLEYILNIIILTLIYLSRYIFLILVCLWMPVWKKPFDKNLFHLEII